MLSPAASFGSRARCWSAWPASRIASAAMQAEVKGMAATAAPISSASTQSPSWPRPLPPSSSGMAAPSQPSSAMALQVGAS
jgi:hypothetical protein